jgi:hypothetical protein
MRNETLIKLDDIVFESLPKIGILGLILHQRYRFEGNVVVKASPVCLGGFHPDYKETLFELGPIIS